jgi:hypothetical protein
MMRVKGAVALLSCMVSLCAGSVWVLDHTAKTLAATLGGQQLTAEGLAATLSTLTGSGLLTINSAAASQVSGRQCQLPPLFPLLAYAALNAFRRCRPSCTTACSAALRPCWQSTSSEQTQVTSTAAAPACEGFLGPGASLSIRGACF